MKSVIAPRVSTGFGSNIPGLHRPSYGNLVFPQAGTLPVRRVENGGGLGAYIQDGPIETVTAETVETLPETAIVLADDETFPAVGPEVQGEVPTFVVDSYGTPIWWELLLLGGVFILLMDSKKGGRYGR